MVELEVVLGRRATAKVLLRRRLANIFGLEFAVSERDKKKYIIRSKGRLKYEVNRKFK